MESTVVSMNLTEYKNGDIVHFEDELYGKGKGAIVGIFQSPEGKSYCIIYPKIPPLSLKYTCFLIEENKVVLTPF
jgi:hypothetical protein